MSLPVAIQPRVWAVRRVSYVHTTNEPRVNNKRYLLDKIITLHKEVETFVTCIPNDKSGSNIDHWNWEFCISFLAVQVIFICVYITNYLHFFTVFLSF